MNHSSATLRRPVLLAIALVTALTMLAAWSATWVGTRDFVDHIVRHTQPQEIQS